ncbi:hypothetical protein GQ607_015666 [Colletotrichum asianum]|uniref:Uncharacterized protein n=1 Tax=Colletotrichum asianum TaxID=702518 RepID=A0A8H3ZEX1_9PEZI|nr:hypothetical protein GQ607_015666 [Colletotrichum asianum]
MAKNVTKLLLGAVMWSSEGLVGHKSKWPKDGSSYQHVKRWTSDAPVHWRDRLFVPDVGLYEKDAVNNSIRKRPVIYDTKESSGKDAPLLNGAINNKFHLPVRGAWERARVFAHIRGHRHVHDVQELRTLAHGSTRTRTTAIYDLTQAASEAMTMPQNEFLLTCRDIAVVIAESHVASGIVDVSAWKRAATSSKENPSLDLDICPRLLSMLLLLATNMRSR